MPGWTRSMSFVITLTLAFGVVSAADACPVESDAALVCEINLERRAYERPPLAVQVDLAQAAKQQASDMARLGFFSHVTPSGRTMVDRLRSVGYLTRDAGPWWAGEVLAWGTGALGTPAAIVDAWMRSPGHRRVLLGRVYREVGVGVARGTPVGRPGATYAAELGSVRR